MFGNEASWPILRDILNGIGLDEVEVFDLINGNTRLKDVRSI